MRDRPFNPVYQSAIALGSNLGDSLATLENALETLDRLDNIVVTARSSWYRTDPVGPPQPDYLNGCALLEVQLTPHELLYTLLGIENQFGRVRQDRWGPRTLDLDLILFEDIILDTPDLKIPHPRMRERAFVLIPLAEIAPHWIDPVSGNTISQLASPFATHSNYEVTIQVCEGKRVSTPGFFRETGVMIQVDGKDPP